MMHPIERLRYLARAGTLPPQVLVQEAAGALAAFADEPQGFLTACQRVIARQPGSAPLVWLAARAVTALDPYDELWIAAEEMSSDPTARRLSEELPESATAVVVGSCAPDSLLGMALARRGDVGAWPLEGGEPGVATWRSGRPGRPQPLRAAWLEDDGPTRWDDGPGVDPMGVAAISLGAAVSSASLVLVEALAIGPDLALVPRGGLTAAACANALGTPVWLVGGVGRHLGQRNWAGLAAPFIDAASEVAGSTKGSIHSPPEGTHDLLPLSLVSAVADPSGVLPRDRAAVGSFCPECPELFRGVVM